MKYPTTEILDEREISRHIRHESSNSSALPTTSSASSSRQIKNPGKSLSINRDDSDDEMLTGSLQQTTEISDLIKLNN
jgi:hypothetical protein